MSKSSHTKEQEKDVDHVSTLLEVSSVNVCNLSNSTLEKDLETIKHCTSDPQVTDINEICNAQTPNSETWTSSKTTVTELKISPTHQSGAIAGGQKLDDDNTEHKIPDVKEDTFDNPSSLCSDINTNTVTEIVTAFQEVKNDFKAVVKDACEEILSSVTEVKQELSYELAKTKQDTNNDQSVDQSFDVDNTVDILSNNNKIFEDISEDVFEKEEKTEEQSLIIGIDKLELDQNVTFKDEWVNKCTQQIPSTSSSCKTVKTLTELHANYKRRPSSSEIFNDANKDEMISKNSDHVRERKTVCINADFLKQDESGVLVCSTHSEQSSVINSSNLETKDKQGENKPCTEKSCEPEIVQSKVEDFLLCNAEKDIKPKFMQTKEDHPPCYESKNKKSFFLQGVVLKEDSVNEDKRIKKPQLLQTDEDPLQTDKNEKKIQLLTTNVQDDSVKALSAPSTPNPSVSVVRRALRPQGCQGRRVSFPEDDTYLISSYLEPVNPWQQMAGVTVDEIAAAYRSSCERHTTQPLPAVLQQIKALPLVVGGRVGCISLRGQRLEGGQCEGLEEILKRVQFKILDLEGCSLEDDTAIPIFDMIEFYDSATQLNISCNSKIGFRGWQACARMLRKTPSVEYLDARNTNLNETNMPILGRALRLGARLHTLHLENCNLTGRPLILLTAALKQNDTLSELYLAENRLGVNDCIQLGNLVRYNGTLRVLDLRNNNVQDAGCGHICEGIALQNQIYDDELNNSTGGKKKPFSKGLNSLILWNNHLTQQSAAALAYLLREVFTLELLNLGRNNLTSEGILQLKESLLRNRWLLRLGLQASRIGDEGAVALAEYTADNPVIQQIDLRENPIRVAGLMALAHSLRLNTTIIQLDLDSDPRTEPAVELADQHLCLQKEIKEYCQRNLTQSHLKEADQPTTKCSGAAPEKTADQRKPEVNANSRKISLTCEPANSSRASNFDKKCIVANQEEEKQKYVSPAPSPLPSPGPSPSASPSPSPIPSPLKNRFRVFKVHESSKLSSQSPVSAIGSPSNHTILSSAPVSHTGRSMSAGDLNKPIKQMNSRPNRFSIGSRFTVTRVTESSVSSSLPTNHVGMEKPVPSSVSGSSSPKIVISSPVRVERGFSIDDTFDVASKSNVFFMEKGGNNQVTSSNRNIDTNECLPDGVLKTQQHTYSPGHNIRLKSSDSENDDVFIDNSCTNSIVGWSDSISQRTNTYLKSGTNDGISAAEKDTDSVSSSELTDSGFLDDSVCSGVRGSGSCSTSPTSPHREGDRDSLLSCSVDSTSQDVTGLSSSVNSSHCLQSSLSSSSSSITGKISQSSNTQLSIHNINPEPLKRAPLAAMENGSFDSDSEDSEVTTQSSDSTHSDEVRITTEQYTPRTAWGAKHEPSGEEVNSGNETLQNVAPETAGSG